MGVRVAWSPSSKTLCSHPGADGHDIRAILWCNDCCKYLYHWTGDFGASGWYPPNWLHRIWLRLRGKI